MSRRRVTVDLFVAPGCTRCSALQNTVKAIAETFTSGAVGVDVVDLTTRMDYAVEVGVRAFPALAINRVLTFPVVRRGRRFEKDFRQAIERALVEAGSSPGALSGQPEATGGA